MVMAKRDSTVDCCRAFLPPDRQGKVSVEISYDKKETERYLGAAVIAFGSALRESMKALAAVKGSADLSWLDELQYDAVRSALETITEQIPVEAEAGAVLFGLKTIDAEFESIRVSLVKSQDT